MKYTSLRILLYLLCVAAIQIQNNLLIVAQSSTDHSDPIDLTSTDESETTDSTSALDSTITINSSKSTIESTPIESTATPTPAPDQTPRNVTVEDVEEHSLSVKWVTVTSHTNFNVRCASLSNGLDSSSNVTTNDGTCAGLTSGALYQVTVTAVDDDWSTEVGVSTPVYTVTVPYPPTVQIYDVTSTSLSLLLSYVSDGNTSFAQCTNYSVTYVSENHTDNALVPCSQTSVDLFNLLNDAEYELTVSTISDYSQNNISFSQANIQENCTLASQVASLSITESGQTYLNVSWQPPIRNKNIIRYIMLVNDGSGTCRQRISFPFIDSDFPFIDSDYPFIDSDYPIIDSDYPFIDSESTLSHFSSLNSCETELVENITMGALNYTYNIEDLTPYVEYNVSLYSVNCGGDNIETALSEVKWTQEGAPGQIDVNSISCTSDTYSSLHIEWSPPPVKNGVILGYNISWTRVEDVEDAKYFLTNDNDTKFNISGLMSYRGYEIQIAARTIAGYGQFSGKNFTTRFGPPQAPINVAAQSLGPNQVNVSWEAVEPITSPPIQTCYLAVLMLDSKEFTDSICGFYESALVVCNLEPYTNYSVHVQAVVTDKEINVTYRENSDVSIVRTGEDRPGIIEANSINATNTTYNSFRVDWSPPAIKNGEISGYNIIWTGIEAGLERSQETNDSSTEFTIANLMSYREYEIQIAARTSEGYGPTSAGRTFATRVGPPQAPENVSATANSATDVTVFWQGAGPITSLANETCYHVMLATILLQYNKTVCGFYETNVIVTGLTAFTNYTVGVLAFVVDSELEIIYQSPSLEELLVETHEAEPTLVRDVSLFSASYSSLNVSWFAPDPPNGKITGYNISWFYGNATIGSGHTTELYYNISGLRPYDYYCVRIAASTNVGPGNYSTNECNRTRVGPVYPPPSNITGTALSPNSMAVSWTVGTHSPALEDQVHYSVYLNDTIDSQLSWNQTVKGFFNTTTTIIDLDEYWPYSACVVAITYDPELNEMYEVPGSSCDTKRTNQSAPGPITDLIITKISQSICYALNVTWDKPLQRDENGILTAYKITTREEPSGQEVTTEVNATARYRTVDVKPDNASYSIIVQAVTIAPGNETVSRIYTGLCAPVVDDDLLGNQIQGAVDDSGSNHFTFESATEFLTNDTNGHLQLKGVIVCEATKAVDGNITFDYGEFNTTFPPWAKARERGFEIPYRATEDSWNVSTTLWARVRQSITVNITIGKGDCLPDDLNIYCNGPVSSGREYKVRLFTCTLGGCVLTPYSPDVFSTIPNPPAAAIPVAAIIVPIMLVLLLVAALLFAYRTERWPFHNSKESIPSAQPYINMTTLSPPPAPVAISSFGSYVDEKIRDSNLQFSSDFELLRDYTENRTRHMPKDVARLDVNIPKNRFADVSPYDYNRVSLRAAENEDGTDYINASFISGCYSRREYIACQGPLESTIEDFWRMVWEQNVQTIVMLTRTVEHGQRRCAQYWPEICGEPVMYGEIQVLLLSSSSLPNYTINIFALQQGDVTRSVTQYYFRTWPDMGCPESTDDLLYFVCDIRNQITPEPTIRPIVVHCSAGVGRTGTFIVIDQLLQHIQTHDNVDVFNTVLEKRGQRPKMVQTEDQYVFIHKCLRDAIRRGLHRTEEPLYANSGNVPAEQLYVRTNQGFSTDPEENIYQNHQTSTEESGQVNAGFTTANEGLVNGEP